MRLGGASFSQGMQMGRGIFNDAEQNRRANAADARAQAEFEQRQAEWDRQRQDRADLDYVGKGGLTGITPNMTQPDANGVGPVAPAQDVDWRYRGLQLGAPPGAAAPAVDPGLATADPGTLVASAAPGLGGALPPADPQIAAAAARPLIGRVPSSAQAIPGQPDANAPPVAGGMTRAQQQEAIAGIALRSGNVQGFNSSQDRAAALKKQQAYEDFGHKLLSMTDDDFADYAKKHVTDNKNAPAQLHYDPKSHQFIVMHDDGPPQVMDRAQAMTHMLSAFEIGNGDVAKGIEMQLNLRNQQIDRQDKIAARDNTLTEQVGGQGIKVWAAERADHHQSTQDALAASRMRLDEARANRLEAAANKAAKDPKWSVVPGVTDKDGNIMQQSTSGEIRAVPNTRQFRDPAATAQATKKDIAEFAKSLIDSGAKGANGKPMVIDEALDRAKEYYNTDPNAKPDIDLSKVAEELKKGRAAPVQAPGKTAAMPPLGNTAPAPSQSVPPPPPQMTTVNGIMQVNPDYVAWQQQYGQPAAAPMRPTPGFNTPIRQQGYVPYGR